LFAFYLHVLTADAVGFVQVVASPFPFSLLSPLLEESPSQYPPIADLKARHPNKSIFDLVLKGINLASFFAESIGIVRSPLRCHFRKKGKH
jgi:hypothetical protein